MGDYLGEIKNIQAAVNERLRACDKNFKDFTSGKISIDEYISKLDVIFYGSDDIKGEQIKMLEESGCLKGFKDMLYGASIFYIDLADNFNSMSKGESFEPV